MMVEFELPLRATQHCRHYSYEMGLEGGPRCARDVDLSAPGASKPCMPLDPPSNCPLREEYTEEERAAWKEWQGQSLIRLGTAVQALPRPIPLNTSGKVECPNCGGTLSFARWGRGAEIGCSTKHCCGARFQIAAGADWPQPAKEEG